jgi:shikimate 5-dehydrogenase
MALVNNLNASFGDGRAVFGRDLEGWLKRADGLVNTTPIGMAKLPGILCHLNSFARICGWPRWCTFPLKPNC